MAYLYSALFLGGLCLIAQLIYEFTKLTPGHITTMYVVGGVFLESFNIYDTILQAAPGGAILPILNFGHLLGHAAVEGAMMDGVMGILTTLLVPASAALVVVIMSTVLAGAFFKPHP